MVGGTPLRLLVIDDEPALLHSMKIYLERQGYEVVACRNATSAWERFAAEPGAYSMVIVDMTVGGMSAEEFIGRVVGLAPEIGVLATSGYPAILDQFRQQDNSRMAYLEKPFTPAMLTGAVQQVLDGRQSASN